MLRFAPRYPPALVALIVALDDETQPIAATWRRVGTAADRLGIDRPSYVHVRRIVLRERRRRSELGVAPADALTRLLVEVVPARRRVLGELPLHGVVIARKRMWLRATRCLRRTLRLWCRLTL